MVQSIEAGGFELAEPIGNHAAPASERAIEPVIEMHVEAVRQQMTAAKPLGV